MLAALAQAGYFGEPASSGPAGSASLVPDGFGASAAFGVPPA
jgi:hypothetical protein